MYLHNDAGRFVCRSGHWVVMKPDHEITNKSDAVLAWERQTDGYSHYVYFVSGGSWLCTSKSGELNVKNEGHYAVMYHNVLTPT
ncbi:hypothetical protein NUU61_007180 [Penicillium alfredii]|uniref:Uncharacterized protein n=1 Tax=Penicillium alfredii TaxID=1506179 RepID=A0A9W9K4B5_9EURO|nr:uncharacterized protein NUU61_007180 [Penicillium alfredii]KAJ5092310.1 hypothetical protein NUU61_007180 [Penicillium alfredii]